MNLIFYTHKVYSSRVSVQTVGARGDSGRRKDTLGSWRRRDKLVLTSSRLTLSGLLAGDATVPEFSPACCSFVHQDLYSCGHHRLGHKTHSACSPSFYYASKCHLLIPSSPVG